jgi:uncharacterized protein YjeT (DUF2065 family)
MPRPALYAEAFGRDPQFAQFYRSLEAYRASFRNKSDVMVIDPAASSSRPCAGQQAAPARRQRFGKRLTRQAGPVAGLAAGRAGADAGVGRAAALLQPRRWRPGVRAGHALSDGQIRFIGLSSMLLGVLLLLFWR